MPTELAALRHDYDALRRQYTLTTLQLLSRLDELEHKLAALEVKDDSRVSAPVVESK